jgi:hypothetical protein
LRSSQPCSNVRNKGRLAGQRRSEGGRGDGSRADAASRWSLAGSVEDGAACAGRVAAPVRRGEKAVGPGGCSLCGVLVRTMYLGRRRKGRKRSSSSGLMDRKAPKPGRHAIAPKKTSVSSLLVSSSITTTLVNTISSSPPSPSPSLSLSLSPSPSPSWACHPRTIPSAYPPACAVSGY